MKLKKVVVMRGWVWHEEVQYNNYRNNNRLRLQMRLPDVCFQDPEQCLKLSHQHVRNHVRARIPGLQAACIFKVHTAKTYSLTHQT